MCSPAAASMIGGGALLQSMGQQRALSAQIAETNAARAAVARANDAARDRALDVAAQVTEKGIKAANTGNIRQELAKMGVTGGDASQVIRQVQAENVPGAVSESGRGMNLDLRRLGSDIRGIRTGLNLELQPHEARMREAGMQGNTLRFLGQMAQIGGQAAAAHAANQPKLSPQAAAIASDSPITPEQEQALNLELGRRISPSLELISDRQRREGLR